MLHIVKQKVTATFSSLLCEQYKVLLNLIVFVLLFLATPRNLGSWHQPRPHSDVEDGGAARRRQR